MVENEPIIFPKKKYEKIRDIGRGAMGKTMLLRDSTIGEDFVCKKYAPVLKDIEKKYYKNFVDEVKILYRINHQNIVRIFSYFLYPEQTTGYILMEYIEGLDIESYIKAHVYSINKIFIQTIEGFSYLEKNKILHRDIRSTNIMINNDGIVKIIDFGFGKDIRKSDNFSLSITLNWQCDIPLDFENGEYTFSTEIYFLGQLFKRIIASCQISSIFKYNGIIKKMCELAPSQRFQSFNEIKKIMYENLQEEEFSTNDKKIYSAFADSLMNVCPSISYDAKCKDNLEEITMNLEALLKNSSLEEYLQNNSLLIKCFISGAYKYEFKKIVPVKQIKEFTQWWKNFSDSKKNIILNNLWERFEPIMEDYLPF